MKVSGGASCQSSAWRVRSFILWGWRCGTCSGLWVSQPSVWAVRRAGSLAGKDGERPGCAAAPGLPQRRTTLDALKCAAEAEPVPAAHARPEASGVIRRRDDALGTTGASPSRPPRRRSPLRCAKLRKSAIRSSRIRQRTMSPRR